MAERLRFAREQALERARAARARRDRRRLGGSRGGAAMHGSRGTAWWLRLASVLPLLALVAGLLLIQGWKTRRRSRPPPRSTPRCSPTICRRPPTATPASPSS